MASLGYVVEGGGGPDLLGSNATALSPGSPFSKIDLGKNTQTQGQKLWGGVSVRVPKQDEDINEIRGRSLLWRLDVLLNGF